MLPKLPHANIQVLPRPNQREVALQDVVELTEERDLSEDPSGLSSTRNGASFDPRRESKQVIVGLISLGSAESWVLLFGRAYAMQNQGKVGKQRRQHRAGPTGCSLARVESVVEVLVSVSTGVANVDPWAP